MPEQNKQHIERVIRRWRTADNRKSQWHQHWEDLARVMVPRRIGFVTEVIEGARNTEELFDGTAMRAARGLANAMAQMLRPEGEQWFFIRAGDDALNEEGEVAAWLEMVERRLMTAIYNPKARFRQASGEADLDLVVFGTAAMFIGRSRKASNLTYQTLHLKNTAVGYDDEGTADTLFRTHWYTLRQAADKFGEDNLSQESRDTLKSKKDEAKEDKLRFLHAVTPRKNGREDAVFSRNLPWAEEWIEMDAKHLVQEAGFHEFPFAVPRWDTSSGEDYGRSPGMVALPDAATAQAMGETILIAGQRAADPPLFAPNDGALDAPNTVPGGMGYYDVETAIALGRNPFFTLDTSLNLPITRDMQNDVREQIDKAFFKHVFNLPLDGPQMTATEIIERKEEFIREIGPVFGRMESDYLAPIVERSFKLMLRSGSFDPIPEALQGNSVRFEYESPVKKIREQAEATAAQLWALDIAALAEVKPDALDNINEDGLARFAHQAKSLPGMVINPREAVEQMRQARAEAEREQMEREKVAQEMQIAQMGGGAMKDVMGAMQPPQQGKAA